MNIKNYAELIKKQQKEINLFFRRQLPIKIGRIAKDHFQENFRKGGFVNEGLQKWPMTKRQQSGASAAVTQYGPLLSGHNHLFSSIKYVPGEYRVKVASEVPYAAIHNEGGMVNPTITPKMRRFAWAMYHKTKGKTIEKKGTISSNPESDRWRALALTKKSKLTIKVPKRRFIGESAELTKEINDKIEKELIKILDI